MIESILGNFWGIIVVIALIALFFVLVDQKIARELAWQFAMEVEKNARKYGIELTWQKKDWVKDWYNYLPPTVKFFVSRKLWIKIVEGIYAQLPEAENGGG